MSAVSRASRLQWALARRGCATKVRPAIKTKAPAFKPKYHPEPPLNPKNKPDPWYADRALHKLMATGAFFTTWIFLWEAGYIRSPIDAINSALVGVNLANDPRAEDQKADTSSAHADTPVTDRVYMDLAIDGEAVGRVVFGLYGTVTPRTAENFKRLCVGDVEHTTAPRKKLWYQDISFHRCVSAFCIQGGDVMYGNGNGGFSIYGRYFDDENFELGHDEEGILSMSNSGANKNSSQFFITLTASPALNGKHVVFGRVLSGMQVLRRVNRTAGCWNGVPKKRVTVAACGVMPTI